MPTGVRGGGLDAAGYPYGRRHGPGLPLAFGEVERSCGQRFPVVVLRSHAFDKSRGAFLGLAESLGARCPSVPPRALKGGPASESGAFASGRRRGRRRAGQIVERHLCCTKIATVRKQVLEKWLGLVVLADPAL